jgi:hypothetical protein
MKNGPLLVSPTVVGIYSIDGACFSLDNACNF